MNTRSKIAVKNKIVWIFGCILLIVILAIPFKAMAADGNLEISVPMFGSWLTLQTSNRFAGAIYSLIWNGQEFINSTDHGREMQSDVFFDNYGICYNPTEAGSQKNGRGDSSSSVLKSARVLGNQLWTTTQMAFWLQPGQYAYTGMKYGIHKNITHAVNKTILSNVILTKHVIVGLPGFPNVIEDSITFFIPHSYHSATFEVLTGYMPKDISQAFYFNPQTMQATSTDGRQGEQRYPVILAMENGRYAMGIYSPGLPQPDWPNAGYGSFKFPGAGVNKWNCVYRYTDVHAGPYHFTCFVVLGNLEEVEGSMHRLVLSIIKS